MAHRISRDWLALTIATVVLVNSLPGCGGTDLTGYRPVSEHGVNSGSTSEPPRDDGDLAKSINVNQTEALDPAGELRRNEIELPPVSALVPVNVVDGSNVRALMSIPTGDDPRTASKSVDSQRPVVSDPPAVAPEPRKIEILIKEKTFRTEPKSGALRLVFDDLDLLKILNMDPVVENAVDLMPDWLRSLDGKTIRLRGVMYPTFDAEGLENFVLARDSQTCCFGPGAKIYDLIQVSMKKGKTTNYIHYSRFIDVIGKFHIEISGQDGKLFGLYSIDDAEVIER